VAEHELVKDKHNIAYRKFCWNFSIQPWWHFSGTNHVMV